MSSFRNLVFKNIQGLNQEAGILGIFHNLKVKHPKVYCLLLFTTNPNIKNNAIANISDSVYSQAKS